MHVVVLMGGMSSEREVSLRSGAAVVDGLRMAGHTVSGVDVTSPDFLLPEKVDAVFVALHGTYGEDGAVQQELRRRGVAFTGSDETASRLAFDKRLSKRLFDRHAVPTPPWGVVREGDTPALPWPVVVKPPCQGSTLGVHRVNTADEWPDALADALSYDREAIVECFIAGRELTVGLLDGEALAVVEVVAPNGWYDYRAKYVVGQTEYLVPAPLTVAQTGECRRLAQTVYRVLGCRGMGRVDFRMDPEDRFFVLEMNTIPGFTETSLLPKAARYAGLDFSSLCDRVLQTAAS